MKGITMSEGLSGPMHFEKAPGRFEEVEVQLAIYNPAGKLMIIALDGHGRIRELDAAKVSRAQDGRTVERAED